MIIGKTVALVIVCALLAPSGAPRADTMPDGSGDGARGFDFLVGEWRVKHRRIPTGGGDWVEFDGTLTLRPLMQGKANVEEHVLNHPGRPYRAIGLRAWDEKSGQWSIWWLDERYPAGPIGPPVRGTFANGVGTFYADYVQDGKPMRGRFRWSEITPTSARWEQASSADGGKTWQPNWIMQLTREGR